MTLRERLRAVLEGRQPDAVPWFTDLTYWHHGHGQRGTLPEKYRGADGLLQLHRDLRVGVYLFTPSMYTQHRDPDLFQEWDEKVDESRVRTFVKTPAGTLEGLVKAAPTSHSSARIEHPVKKPEDLRVVREWYEGTTFTENYAEVEACDREWGEDGFPIPLIPRTPLATLAAHWAGVTNLSYIIADAPELFEETMEAMRRAEDEMYRIYADSPFLALEIGENLSAEAMTGLWRRYSRDYYEARTALLHERGKLVGCHIDGTLGMLLSELVEAGIDFPESVVPAPVGDLTLTEIADSVREDTIIWGCVPSAMFAPPFDRQTVIDFVDEAIDTLAPRCRLVLAGADQVPPDGDIELVRIIGEHIEERGWPA